MPTPQDWHDLNPPPEVLALGAPERLDLRTKAGWKAGGWAVGGWAGRPLFDLNLPNDPRTAAGIGLAVIGVVLLACGLVTMGRAPAVVVQVGCGGGVCALIAGVGLLLTRPSAADAAAGAESQLADEHAAPHRPLTGVTFAFGFFPEAVAHTNGREWVVVRYDEVLEYHGPCPGRHYAELACEGGRTVRLRESDRDFLNDFPVLSEVERRLFPYLRARVEYDLEAGRPVQFGPVGLSTEGLTYRGRSVGWMEMKQVEVASPGTTTYWGGGTGGARDAHLLVSLYGAGPRPSLLWGTLGQDTSGWWIDERFLTLPNRAVLLTKLAAHRSVGVTHAVGLFMPWNPKAA